MLNVSKRSLVDAEFSVSTFGMENSNFLPSSKVVHSSLCTAFGVSAWGSLDKKKKIWSWSKRPLYQLPVVTALMSQGWRIWCSKPYSTLQLSPGLGDREEGDPSTDTPSRPHQAVIVYSA